ncbi:MAG TPA: pyridoxamine 5'-phosphate oxidase family protein, partial [Candidatus Limnocylindrales bacterium]
MAAPDLAVAGRRLFERLDSGSALLATVRGDRLPRIHPITISFLDDRLVAFLIEGSAKIADLDADGRYAMHAHQDPIEPHEFLLRGRATTVTDRDVRTAIAADWAFDVDETYRLVEFFIEHAVIGRRADPDAWPPRYTSWRAPKP